MQDFNTLKLLDRFERLFTLFGVDYKIMRKILQVKLTMDGRRTPTIFSQNASKKGQEQKNQYIKSLWIYVLFGLFLIPFILMGDQYIFQMSLVYGMLTFFIMTSMISDFSTVLLDIRDRNILFTKPVNQKTISTAKIIHVIIYLSFLTIAFVGIPLIVSLFTKGILFFFLFGVNIILIDLFIVVLTAFIYMFILKFFDGEKLKDIINYVQIGLSLTIMIGYQILVRSFEFMNFTISFEPNWWHLFVFPIWFGANTELLLNGNFEPLIILFSVLSVVIPIISILIYIKLTPVFEYNLQKLSYHGKPKEKRKSKIGQIFIRIICRSKEERTFYRFASLMMKNEREFKLKVYPSLGFSVIVPFILIFSSLTSDFDQLTKSNSYLSIYFSVIVIPTVVILLRFSGKYKGAWIYRVAPLNHLRPLFSGTFKAFITKLYLPVYLLLSVIFIAIFGFRIVPDLVVVFLNACIYAIVCFMFLEKKMPFSESFDQYNQNGNGVTVFLLMIIVVLFAGLHYLSLQFVFGVYIYMLLATICLAILWKKAFNLTWDDILVK